MNRRQWIGGMAASLRAAARKPNFVLITGDDMGYADIAPYREGVDYTPNLARMAREGTRFTSWYAAPVCSPSRAALMTGCYPKRVGLSFGSWHAVLMPGDWHGLNPAEITVARLLKGLGYATGCVGKWHLGDQPEFLPRRHGFDSYFGLPYSNDMRPGLAAGGGRERPHPPLPLLRNEDVVKEVTDQDFLTGEYTKEAIRFLERQRGGPFFLYLAHSMVHAPLAAGSQWRGRTGKGLYADSVAEVDDSVGQILDAIGRLGLAGDTIVIFLSDNGGTARADNRPLRGNKGSTWEGGMRVPAIVWGPGRVASGGVSDAMVSNMDILPTFASLAGGKAPADRRIDGQDISALLAGKSGAESGYRSFYYYHANRLQAVREGRWKLHVSGELYDLLADIGESRNVAGENAEVVKRLLGRLEEARADMGDGTHEGNNVRPCGKAKGPLRFWIPRHAGSGHPPHAPVKSVTGAPEQR